MKIIKSLKKESELPNLISNLCEDKYLEKLVTLSIIINSNNKIFSLMALLCIIKKKRKNVIFKYDDESMKDNIYDIFKKNELNKININKISKEDILYVNLLNKNISCEYIKQENIFNDTFETNDFEIICQHLNGDKFEKKIISIKTFFNKEINNMISTEMDKRFESIEKKLEVMSKEKEELREELNKQGKEKEELKKEINILNTKIKKLEKDKIKYDNLKGGFVFKSFIDYLFLIFDINIDLEFRDKKLMLKEKSGKYFKEIFVIIQRMKDLYYDQTNITHGIPTYDEITASILDQYDSEEDSFIFKIMEKLKPQKEIKNIIIKNNELTKVMLGKESHEEKENMKKEINKQINELIPKNRKIELVKNLEEILEEYWEL